MKQVRHCLCIHKTKLYLLYKLTKLCWLAAYNLASQEQWHYPCVVELMLWQKLNLAKFTNGKYSNRWWPVIHTKCWESFMWSHSESVNYQWWIWGGGIRGPPFGGYFCVHNCMSLSNDYAAVTCSNNNQAQLHTHVSVPYQSLEVWLETCFEKFSLDFHVTRSGCGSLKFSDELHVPVAEPPFLNF